MRKLIATLALVLGFSTAHGATYTLDKEHSSVGFKIRHLVSKTAGQFKDYDVKLQYDAQKPETSSVEATIQTTSVDTSNVKRDEHLRGADFFNVAKFPTMTYKSTSVKRVAPNKLQVEGTLTMLGVSKPTTLDVEEGGVVKTPWGDTRAGFTASTKINRKDFGMAFNKVLDTGSLMLGEDVEITIEIEAADASKTPPVTPAKKKK